MKKVIKRMIIEGSVLAAVGSFVFFASGIEGNANILLCAVGMAVCLAWMYIVAIANS